jgi:hypothetical protein
MTQPAEPTGQGPEGTEPPGTATGTPPTQEETLPPYHQELEALPESVRHLVEPVFKEWDSKTTQRFQELHTQYEPYKPVLESGYDPSTIQQTIALAEALEQDPQAVVAALAEAYGIDLGRQNEELDEEDDEDEDSDPRLKQHEEMLATMAQYLMTQQQEQQQAQEDDLLDQALAELQEKHGAFDERYVLTLLANGYDPEQAVLEYKNAIQQATGGQPVKPQAPTILGSGGGTPTTTIANPSELNPKDTKNLIVEMLKAANQG